MSFNAIPRTASISRIEARDLYAESAINTPDVPRQAVCEYLSEQDRQEILVQQSEEVRIRQAMNIALKKRSIQIGGISGGGIGAVCLIFAPFSLAVIAGIIAGTAATKIALTFFDSERDNIELRLEIPRARVNRLERKIRLITTRIENHGYATDDELDQLHIADVFFTNVLRQYQTSCGVLHNPL